MRIHKALDEVSIRHAETHRGLCLILCCVEGDDGIDYGIGGETGKANRAPEAKYGVSASQY